MDCPAAAPVEAAGCASPLPWLDGDSGGEATGSGAAGTAVADAAFDRGAGLGWFANLMALNAYVDVGRARGDWRVHVRFGTGF